MKIKNYSYSAIQNNRDNMITGISGFQTTSINTCFLLFYPSFLNIQKNIVFILLFTTAFSFGQQNNLSVFDNLMNKTWKAEGKWGDGSKFKQEIEFSYDLNHTIVIAKSKGFTNKEQTEYGPRNHGIRKYNAETKTIEFWEFDVFGGLTKGTVKIDGKNIIYTYTYGTSTVTDMWEYVDEGNYIFKVGNYENGKWKQVYLETEFKGYSER